MEHQLTDHGVVTILRLKGDLTFEEVEDLGNILHQTVQDTNGEIVVDLSNVGFADSSVTGQFIAAKREADVKRKGFVLSNLSPTVKKVLRTGRADYQVPLYDSIEEAIADLAEQARGGEPRKVVRNIRCGHEDCVFYTYVRTDFAVVPACEYAYPEEITNGPNCRCYRVNWKDLEGLSPEEESPFRKGRKKDSPYVMRDSHREEPPPPASPEAHEEDFELEPGFSAMGTEEAPMNPVPHDSPVASTNPVPTEDDDWDFSTGSDGGDDVVLDDPFADTNFPSAAEQSSIEPSPTPEPSPPPSPAPVQSDPPHHHHPPVETEPEAPPVEVERPSQVEIFPAPEPVHTAAVRVEPDPLTPMEVVHSFVEAWNDARFEVEYDLLSSQSESIDRNDYCARRRALRNLQFEKHGRATKQGIAEEDGHSIQKNIASVEITRIDRTPKGVRCYAQYYTLVNEDGHWKVQTVRDGEIRKNPTNPPKGRKMNTSQFFGKSKGVKGKPPTF